MAISVDYVILPHLRKKDGTNYIRIRVTNRRKSKYIKTNIVVEPEHLTRSGNLKHQGIIDRVDAEVKKWRSAAGKLPSYVTNDMDLDRIIRSIESKLADNEGFSLNFARYGMQIADKKKQGTGDNYRSAIRCLVRYFGYEPDISEITVRAMRGFEEFIKNEGKVLYSAKKGIVKVKGKSKTGRAVSMYTGAVRTIYKHARLEFNDPDLDIMRIPVDIFEYYKVPKPPAPEHRDIPMEWVQMMIDQRKVLRGRQRIAIDAFLMCFGLMGMNAIDMYTASKAKKGIVHYYRTKTKDKKADKAEMFVRIEPCIKAIMADYLGSERLFDFHTRYSSSRNLITALNMGLKQWQEDNKLKKFTFYAARHAWATIAASKQVGVDYAIVTEGLTHSDASRAMDKIYIRKDWERVWDANAKVLALFRWE